MDAPRDVKGNVEEVAQEDARMGVKDVGDAALDAKQVARIHAPLHAEMGVEIAVPVDARTRVQLGVLEIVNLDVQEIVLADVPEPVLDLVENPAQVIVTQDAQDLAPPHAHQPALEIVLANATEHRCLEGNK